MLRQREEKNTIERRGEIDAEVEETQEENLSISFDKNREETRIG
jgi:hypothetical protein